MLAKLMDEMFPARRVLYQMGQIEGRGFFREFSQYVKQYLDAPENQVATMRLGDILAHRFTAGDGDDPYWGNDSFLRGLVGALNGPTHVNVTLKILHSYDVLYNPPKNVPLGLMRVEVTVRGLERVPVRMVLERA